MSGLMQAVIIQQESELANDLVGSKMYLDNIKFTDKLALIITHEAQAINFSEDLRLNFSVSGSATRDDMKHNFMCVLSIFRRRFTKVLEDFKELMLVLNSSHMQISSSMLINIDMLVLEFHLALERICNHGNRTFRNVTPDKQNHSISSVLSLSKPSSERRGNFESQTLNKVPFLLETAEDSDQKPWQTSAVSSRRRGTEHDLPPSEEGGAVLNWMSLGSSAVAQDDPAAPALLRRPNKKYSLPYDSLGHRDAVRMANSDFILSRDPLQKSDLSSRTDTEDGRIQSPTSLVTGDDSPLPRSTRSNETRLRLNLKRKEIERSRQQMQEQKMREQQLLTDRVFRDVVALRQKRPDAAAEAEVVEDQSTGSSEDWTAAAPATVAPMRMGEVKRRGNSRKHRRTVTGAEAVTRSRSQDYNKRRQQRQHQKQQNDSSDITASIDQLKSEITRLTSEHAILSERINAHTVTPTEVVRSPVYQPISQQQPQEQQRVTKWATAPPPAASTPASDFHPLPLDQIRLQTTQYQPAAIQLLNMVDQPRQSPSTHRQPPPAPPASAPAPARPPSLPESSKPTVSVSKESQQPSSNDSQTFFITFEENDAGSTKKLQQPPSRLTSTGRARMSLETESSNGNVDKCPRSDNLNKNSQDNSSSSHSNRAPAAVIESPSKAEKPVSFLITIDNQVIEEQSAVTVNKEKLTSLAEKREHERLERIQNVKLQKQVDMSRRAMEEQEKERVKLEKKQKRDAIFEAYKKRKEEVGREESGLPTVAAMPTAARRDASVNKSHRRRQPQHGRAISMAPVIHRSQSHGGGVGQDFDRQSSGANSSINNGSTGESSGPQQPPVQFGSWKFPNSTQPAQMPPSMAPGRLERTITMAPNTKLFVQPKLKSNRSVIQNALRHCCLAGRVNDVLKLQSVEELEQSNFCHFMVLMRGGCQYRGVYGFDEENEALWKVSGIGPRRITTKMVDKFYKYNSGAKKFSEILSTNHLSSVVDGVIIFNTLWKTNTSVTNNHNSQSETSSQADINPTL